MTDVDVRALASLARLDVADDELATLQKELPEILGFVETIQSASSAIEQKEPQLKNVMRSDDTPHETGLYTERLLREAPVREGDRIAVKQVISRK